MEESTTKRTVKDLLAKARGAASVLTSDVERAINLLAIAIERSIDEAPAWSGQSSVYDPLDELVHDPDVPSSEQIEELYAKIVDRIEPTDNTSTGKFVISFPEVVLDLSDIWPNDDAPENPTPDDVVAVMKETKYAHPMTVTTAWRLIDALYVHYQGDENGDMGVEWDGT